MGVRVIPCVVGVKKIGVMDEIFQRRRNIFIGVSLMNHYFSRRNIEEYVLWALKYTKDAVLVVIPDKIAAVNYQVRWKCSEEEAMQLAYKKGDDYLRCVEKLREVLSASQSDRVHVIRWEVVEKDESYRKRTEIFREEFFRKGLFYKRVIRIVEGYAESTSWKRKFSQEEYEKLAEYVLNEMSMLVAGVVFEGVAYTLLPYPHLSDIDYLAMNLQKGLTFPELANKLDIPQLNMIVGAYVE
jgi:tRNA-dependent cyclodipeptide synthase